MRFVLFLAKIQLTNGMTPKMLEECGEQVNITIGFSVDNVIFRTGIIMIANQSVLAMFRWKILCAKPEKHDIDYIDGKDIKISIWVSVNKYRYQWYR